MTFLELAAERYSVRKFSDRPVEEEKLNKILEAVRLAPTAVNKQPQRVYVLRSAEAMETARTLSPCLYGAGTVLLFCYDKENVWSHPTDHACAGEVDTAIACTHAMMEAWELGIGSCWVRFFEAEKVKAALKLPDNLEPVALLPIGYAAEDAAPGPQHAASKTLDELVTIL